MLSFAILDADREYQQIAEYKKSSAFEKKISNINNNKIRLSEMAKRSKYGEKLSKDEGQAKYSLEGIIKIDENDIKATEADYDYYLECALKSYLKCVKMESDTIASNRSFVFRIFSLWLANKAKAIVNETIKKHIKDVPSHKFVPLMPQITTHLGPNDDDFSQLIKQIVGEFVNPRQMWRKESHVMHRSIASTFHQNNSLKFNQSHFDVEVRE